MLIEIKHRWNESVLFSHDQEENSLKITLETAVKAHANLTGANMAGANLAGANLAGANLAGANLASANLAGANLANANMAGANLAGANMVDANIEDAYMAGANMAGAKIEGETLTIQPIHILGLPWPVSITDGYLRIGCQRHTHERWFEFSDDLIAKMDSHAAEFWEMWKLPLMNMCVKHAKKCKEQG